jgi:hypothetical protein
MNDMRCVSVPHRHHRSLEKDIELQAASAPPSLPPLPAWCQLNPPCIIIIGTITSSPGNHPLPDANCYITSVVRRQHFPLT